MPVITHHLRLVRRLQILEAAIASVVLLIFAYVGNRDGGSVAKNGGVLSQRTRFAGMSHAVGHVDGGPPPAGHPCNRGRVDWSPKVRQGPLRQDGTAVLAARHHDEDGG